MQGMIERLMDPDAPRKFPVMGNFKMNEGREANPEYVAYMQKRQQQIEAIGGQQKLQELRAQAKAQGMVGFIQTGRWVNQQIKSLYAAKTSPAATAAPGAPAAPAPAPMQPATATAAPAPDTPAAPTSVAGQMPSAQQTALQGGVKTVELPASQAKTGMISSLMQR